MKISLSIDKWQINKKIFDEKTNDFWLIIQRKKIHMHFKTLRENFLKEIFVKYIEAKLIDVSGDRDPIRLN